MGVRGLSSFFDQNPVLSSAHQLRDTTVVIDGNNLIHMLYFSYKVDCVYGGDYNRFAGVIRKYFSSYIECNIKPIIIFDGGYDKSNRKLKTVMNRAKKRLTVTQHIVKYGSCPEKILPILAHEVFKDVLEDMGIIFAQCDYEADDQITALANYYKCPVISQDSDFYIFDIPHGFIRLDFIDSTICKGVNAADQEFSFLNCKIYYIDNFLSFFPGIEKNVLPLFGTLIGNDFVHINVFDNFFSNIHLPKFKPKLKVSQRHKKMIGLLSWLKYNNLQDAIKQVLNHLKKEKRESVKNLIDQALEGYKVQICNLMHHIDNYKQNVEQNDPIASTLSSFCGKTLPNWFVKKFQTATLSPFLLNAISLHRIFLSSQVEDTSLPSSYTCSHFLRQVLYGLLLSHDVDDIANHEKSEIKHFVEEYDRRSGSLQKMLVEPIFSIKGLGMLPKLDELNSLDKNYCKLLIVEIIGDEIEYFSALPHGLQLLVGSIRFWLRNCTPKPSVEYVSGLIMHIIFFSIISPILSTDIETVAEDKQNLPENLNINFLSDAKNIPKSNAIFFSNTMKKYFKKPEHNNKNPILLHIIHSFSQLQSSFMYLLYLNKLLGCPFISTKVHESLGGTVFYNLTRDLLSRPFPELFLSELIGRSTVLDCLFMKLKNKVIENIPEDCFVKNDVQAIRKKKKKKSSQKSTNTSENIGDEEDVMTCNKFKYLDDMDEECRIVL